MGYQIVDRRSGGPASEWKQQNGADAVRVVEQDDFNPSPVALIKPHPTSDNPHYQEFWSSNQPCDIFWGSHGCAMGAGHAERGYPTHVCGSPFDPVDEFYGFGGACSEHTGTAVRYYQSDETWSEWMPSETFTT